MARSYPQGSSAMTDVDIVIFHPNGDLRIRVLDEEGNEPGYDKICVVSRWVMMSTSPVFEAMLGPRSRFLESRTDGATPGSLPTIRCWEEFPSIFETVLENLHEEVGLSEWCPTSAEGLFQLATIVDKYDLEAYINRFRHHEAHFETSISPEELPSDIEGRMFVAYTLGWDETFQHTTSVILKNMSFNLNGDPVFLGARLLNLERLSQPCYAVLLRLRAAAIKVIEDILWAAPPHPPARQLPQHMQPLNQVIVGQNPFHLLCNGCQQGITRERLSLRNIITAPSPTSSPTPNPEDASTHIATMFPPSYPHPRLQTALSLRAIAALVQSPAYTSDLTARPDTSVWWRLVHGIHAPFMMKCTRLPESLWPSVQLYVFLNQAELLGVLSAMVEKTEWARMRR